MQKNRILFYDSDNRNRRDGVRILAASGSQVIAAKSLRELESLSLQYKYNLYILDIEGHKHLNSKGLLQPEPHAIIMAKSGLNSIYPYLENMERFTNFIAKDRHNRLSSRDLLGTVSKILHRDIFGMKKYLGWGAHTMTFHVRDSENRQEYIECLKDQCRNMGLRRSILNDVETVTEEFLMNAIYDAPVDRQRNRLFNHLKRTNRIQLTPEQAARLEFGSDGKRLAISVTDPFGSITRDHVMSYLSKCFQGENITNLDDSISGGAGLGLYFCFNHVHSLIINVDPLNRTEFIGIIDIDSSVRESKKQKTNFHFFNTNNKSREFLLGDDHNEESDTATHPDSVA
ncbi:hypothetical protein [Pseudobacteriovorax antillogorgiicola]|uniref:Uncharacterized protein n=1 Tax=Pseudobacteriovorax antillogorgiicola TaxID=1513793 RepID=A0A1Y6C2V6_9BACT|nr:hypothetical protein [Pseudobacteriovorax antillogorgiicola]TCS50695.1 hypothetical protein EDD56_11278 [Pseudobacteriovorax antillogorgiicola]SMF40431.1 hypothetical protein SAMN06296036_11277 [Pseudobacteriovorax antillogorgiicola]